MVSDYETILHTVEDWPVEQRIQLIQDILSALKSSQTTQMPSRPPRKRTLEQALGLLATDKPAPSDAEVKQWLEEHRMEKYG